jgi:N-dimethylarginine dimethylaminohydrolase
MTDTFSLRTRRDDGNTPVLTQWGADSETGVLRDVLIGPVDHFKNILPTNSVNRKMIREGVTLDVEGARLQYQEMLDCYRHADVNVHITPADPDLPLQIWARDGSFMTPWGMVIGQMAQWWRRGEGMPVIDMCFDKQIPIYEKVTAGCAEGGDFMMIKPGHALMGYSGERSQEVGATQIQRWLEAEGWECYLYEFDPFFVHMDVMTVMLTDNLAAVCSEILDPRVIERYKSLGIDTVEVPYRHALKMGCNVVSLGNDRVLLPKESTFLVDRCKALGLTVYDPDISKISICGGGVHCMSQPLRRDPA